MVTKESVINGLEDGSIVLVAKKGRSDVWLKIHALKQGVAIISSFVSFKDCNEVYSFTETTTTLNCKAITVEERKKGLNKLIVERAKEN